MVKAIDLVLTPVTLAAALLARPDRLVAAGVAAMALDDSKHSHSLALYVSERTA